MNNHHEEFDKYIGLFNPHGATNSVIIAHDDTAHGDNPHGDTPHGDSA